jgi:hypothetical protein
VICAFVHAAPTAPLEDEADVGDAVTVTVAVAPEVEAVGEAELVEELAVPVPDPLVEDVQAVSTAMVRAIEPRPANCRRRSDPLGVFTLAIMILSPVNRQPTRRSCHFRFPTKRLLGHYMDEAAALPPR